MYNMLMCENIKVAYMVFNAKYSLHFVKYVKRICFGFGCAMRVENPFIYILTFSCGNTDHKYVHIKSPYSCFFEILVVYLRLFGLNLFQNTRRIC